MDDAAGCHVSLDESVMVAVAGEPGHAQTRGGERFTGDERKLVNGWVPGPEVVVEPGTVGVGLLELEARGVPVLDRKPQRVTGDAVVLGSVKPESVVTNLPVEDVDVPPHLVGLTVVGSVAAHHRESQRKPCAWPAADIAQSPADRVREERRKTFLGPVGGVEVIGPLVRFAGVGVTVEELHPEGRLVVGDVQVGDLRERRQRERHRRCGLGKVTLVQMPDTCGSGGPATIWA